MSGQYCEVTTIWDVPREQVGEVVTVQGRRNIERALTKLFQPSISGFGMISPYFVALAIQSV